MGVARAKVKVRVKVAATSTTAMRTMTMTAVTARDQQDLEGSKDLQVTLIFSCNIVNTS